MNRRSEQNNGNVRDVVSYADDVFAWVYLDQIDRVIRYEAYVVGYDEHGRQTTLDFVLEEGVLDNMHEVPLLWDLYQEQSSSHDFVPMPSGTYDFTADGRLIAPAPLKHFYSALDAEQLKTVHAYFAAREKELKDERRHRWTRMLRALGYDVIPSL